MGRTVVDLSGHGGAVARRRLLALRREVVVHHGDLGFGPVPLPAGLVSEWLARDFPSLANRTDPSALLAWVIGRGGAPELAPW